jgi:lipopolysaccharide transport system ATP-binding protein
MTAIEFENVSKQYRLGLVSTGTLAHDLNRFWQTRILGREDPYLKIGETNDRSTKGESDYVWALRDINFKVEQGDVVGIIGRNGAGKSTLLKLLSRVTAPTTGVIRARGRIASLLEVGTGFHPEMTGRENIFMNGSIMGMSHDEITRKLDEIVDFSGCERYLDTPVKRYSSGMTVRLGFAIAAHLEPEILVVDEVLAVGDAEFQKKAVGKMQDVSRGGGRTVLFVSHNMAAVRNLCKTGILLNQGRVECSGPSEDTINTYLSATKTELCPTHVLSDSDHIKNPHYSKELEIVSVSICNQSPILSTDEPIELELVIKNNDSRASECQYTAKIFDSSEMCLLEYSTDKAFIPKNRKLFTVKMKLLHHDLFKGFYKFQFVVGIRDYTTKLLCYDATYDVLSFEIRYADSESKKEYVESGSWISKVVHTNKCLEYSIC